MHDKETELEIGKIIWALASMYPAITVGQSTVNAYVSMLKDIPLQILKTVIDQVGCESKFFPTIAEIREKAIMLQLPDFENGITAWGDVKKAFAKYGFYRLPKFDNPITAQAVECLGWKELCSSENEEADRAHFARIYDDLVRRNVQNAKMLPAARDLREQRLLHG